MFEEKIFFPYSSDVVCETVPIKTIQAIYERLADDISKRIFIGRLLYSLTKDLKFGREVILSTKEGRELEQKLKSLDKGVYIYGAGIRGGRLPFLFPEVDWRGYIDNKKIGTCNGLSVCNMDEIPNVRDASVLISNVYHDEAIRETLVEKGFRAENILALNDFDKSLIDRQYFEEFLKIKQGAMIDGGGYDGQDVIHFYRHTGDYECKYYLFEPDENNVELCKDNLKMYPNGRIIRKGLSDTESKLKFEQKGSTGACFSETGESEVELTTIDSLRERVSFIKADVEGFEKKMLLGARETISKHKPICAISVYHKKEDIWEIPELLMHLNKNYKFYLRQYSVGIAETVLYAVDNEE